MILLHFIIAFFAAIQANNKMSSLEEYNIYCYNIIKNQKVDEIFNNLSRETQTTTSKKALENMVSVLSNDIGNIESINSIKIKKVPFGDRVINEIVTDMNTDKERVIFTLDVVIDTDGHMWIDGFKFSVMPRTPKRLFSFKNASSIHYVIFIMFVLILIVQLVCIIMYLRFKPKRKWIYVILSLVGAPIGIKVNWTTLIYSISIGYNIPAAGINQVVNGDKAHVILLFFPLGIIFLVDLLRYRKRQTIAKIGRNEEKHRTEVDSKT